MSNTKPIGVAYEDQYLNGAVINNATITNSTVVIPGTTLDGVIVGDTSGTAGFYGTTPVAQGAALTTQLTSITASAPGTPDYAIQDLTDTDGFGFKTADEGQTVLKVILNLQTRVAELEARLQAYGLLP
jgi:hypothetical protein